MAVTIGHAVMDENGGIGVDGAIAGDQTGKEITTRKFYVRTNGWHTVLRCKDTGMADKAARYMRLICDDSSYGYSQPNRWTGYKSIEKYIKAGYSVETAIANGGGDFDCSSLVISCYIFAGLNHTASGYTGSIVKSFMQTGKFEKFTDEKHINSDNYAKIGDVYVGNGHTMMVLENGSEEPITVKPPYVLIIGGSVIIRKGAGTIYPKLGITAHKGEKYPYFETDEDTGWYWIETPKGRGCITGKPKYTELVLK